MTNEVQVYGMDRQIQVSEDQKRLVKSIIFPGCSDDELKLYLFECERRGVHPLDRLIFPIKRNVKGQDEKRITFQCSVDYLRAEAADTGEYDGQDEPAFGPADQNGYPEYASVSVYKKDMSRPVTGTARWKEYYPGESMGFMWRKMPFHMLAKCAEVLALRKAFPKRLAGLYVPEEMQNVDADQKPPFQPPRKKVEEPKKEAATITEPDAPASEKQIKAIHAIMRGMGITDDFGRHEKGSRILEPEGTEVMTSFSGLTKGQASQIIDALNAERG